jgi:prefoldin alpha subunit
MKDDMQKKYVEFQMIQQQMQQLQQQIEKFDKQLMELNGVITALEEFKTMKKGSDMLVPLASGIFASGELKDAEHVRVNVGANVSVKKSIPDTISLVKQQIDEIEKYKVQMIENLTQMNQHIHVLQQDLMSAAEKEKKEEKKE